MVVLGGGRGGREKRARGSLDFGNKSFRFWERGLLGSLIGLGFDFG